VFVWTDQDNPRELVAACRTAFSLAPGESRFTTKRELR